MVKKFFAQGDDRRRVRTYSVVPQRALNRGCFVDEVAEEQSRIILASLPPWITTAAKWRRETGWFG